MVVVAPLQSADLEKGARQLLDQLDDLAVDVPKAPLQVGLRMQL